ncbi:MAG: hypothetical protein P8123_00170 [bacterium]
MRRMAGCVAGTRLAYAIIAGLVVIMAGYVSPSAASEPQTTVMWYGAGCKDETDLHLEYGDLVQLIRSPDDLIGVPDEVTGEPTGNDVVADTATYLYPEDAFQADDWSETEDWYVCVRIWNSWSASGGTYYWDSVMRQATGMLPIDIDCSGAMTDKAKWETPPTETPTEVPTITPTGTPTIEMSPTSTPTAMPPAPTETPTDAPTVLPTGTPEPTPTSSGTPAPTLTPTGTPEMSPTPTTTPTDTPEPTLTPLLIPTATSFPTATPMSVLGLGASNAEVGTGDALTMNLTIGELVTDGGDMALYAVVQTPAGAWMSFVPQGGGIALRNGLIPALVAPVIPAIERTILSTAITDTLPRGDYRFIAAVFNAGDRITLANWKSLALYSAETVVVVR